jgi:hypothetical protein
MFKPENRKLIKIIFAVLAVIMIGGMIFSSVAMMLS